MKYLIQKWIVPIIIFISVILVYLLVRDKDTSNDQSNILYTSDSSCYNSLAECNLGCNGYRCSGNCAAGSQCSASETGCYGSKSECQSTCTGTICVRGTCVATGPCSVGTIGSSCWLGSSDCASHCNGYRCSGNCAAGSECSASETGCYGSQSECQSTCTGTICVRGTCVATGPCSVGTIGSSCWLGTSDCASHCNGYRCSGNCAAGSQCSASETGCYGSQSECQSSCSSTGYRCSNSCNPGTLCLSGETGCYNSIYECNQGCQGYRCRDNCMQKISCVAGETGCYNNVTACRTNCNGIRCNAGVCVSSTACLPTELNTNCWLTLTKCQEQCTIKPRATQINDCGYTDKTRGWYDISLQGGTVRNDYCRWVGVEGVGPGLQFSCKLAGTTDDKAKNPDGTIKDYRMYENTTHDPLFSNDTNCPVPTIIVKTVFDRIADGENIKFKIVNKATNAVLQSAQDVSNCGSTKWGNVVAAVVLTDANSSNPGMWWRFKRGTNGNLNDYFIVSDCDTYLQCPTETSKCIDPYRYNVNDPSYTLIRLDVVDSVQGTCKLWSKNKQGYIYATGGCWGGGPSFDCYLAASTTDNGDKSIWKLVPQ